MGDVDPGVGWGNGGGLVVGVRGKWVGLMGYFACE